MTRTGEIMKIGMMSMPLARAREREKDSRENATTAVNGDIRRNFASRDQRREEKTKEKEKDVRDNATTAMNGDIRQIVIQHREKQKEHGTTQKAREKEQWDQWDQSTQWSGGPWDSQPETEEMNLGESRNH